MENLEQIKQKVIEVGRLMYKRGLVAATDGNISVKLDDNKLLITRSGICKGRMEQEDLLIITTAGNVIDGEGKPSSEYRLHTLIYSQREDVKAVIHAHPPLLTAFTLAGEPFNSAWFPEVWLSIGPVATASYATPTTDEVPKSIKPYVKNHNAILLERHGTVTYSSSLESSYNMLEKLEHAALIALYTRFLSGKLPDPLTSLQLDKLNSLLRGEK